MTCKDTINSDETQRKSDEEKRYLVSEVTRYNKIFEYDLQGKTDQYFYDLYMKMNIETQRNLW